jgi:protein-disulfide isomerase
MAALGAGPLSGQTVSPDRLQRYFDAWYAYFPGSTISVTPAPDLSLPGMPAFRVERHSNSQSHQESNLALVDVAKDEVLVGDVFGDASRRGTGRLFDAMSDVPKIQASLAEAFGLPVRVSVPGASRGPLWATTIEIRQRPDAVLSRAGFISKDGSLLALGEFLKLSESPREFRRRLLAERPGVRTGSGRYTLTEFLDFQCERCRIRAPEVEALAAKSGGAVEARFMPLVRHHEWAYTAAECASALAAIDPKLFVKYRQMVFARAESLNEAGCREIGKDVAESGGAVTRYEEEIRSGRARERVLADMRLAARLGVSITPTFLYDGILVSGENGLLERALAENPAAAAGGKKP